MGFVDRFKRSRRSADWIMERELLVPTADLGQELGVRMLEADEEIPFLVAQDEEGLSVLPAFTSEDALTRWKPQGSHYIGLKGAVLVDLLAGSEWHRMVVDAADPDAFVITRDDARNVVRTTTLSWPEGEVRIGQPAQPPPDGLIRALRRACERERAVSEAFLYQIQHVDLDERPHMAVGLLLSIDEERVEPARISESIARQLEPARWGYEFIDIHLLDDELLALARTSGPPIFARS